MKRGIPESKSQNETSGMELTTSKVKVRKQLWWSFEKVTKNDLRIFLKKWYLRKKDDVSKMERAQRYNLRIFFKKSYLRWNKVKFFLFEENTWGSYLVGSTLSSFLRRRQTGTTLLGGDLGWQTETTIRELCARKRGFQRQSPRIKRRSWSW